MHLKQSTASQSVLIGPFVDTDGAAVTGLTIDAADIRLGRAFHHLHNHRQAADVGEDFVRQTGRPQTCRHKDDGRGKSSHEHSP
jgi:hypothetical protein